MPKTGENIYKRRDGRWEARYIADRIGGKIKYGYIYSKTYSEAKKKLYEAVSKNKPAAKNNSLKKNFGSYAVECIDTIRPQLKMSTIANYENLLNNYVYPYFRDMPITDISNDDLTRFTNEMLSSGSRRKNGLSVKTVSLTLSIMKRIFAYASTKGVLISADTKAVSLHQHPKDIHILSVEEQKKICCFIAENTNLSNLGIMLCLFTGLRIGELCALKWGDISLSDKALYVNKTMQRIKCSGEDRKTKIIITSPKSDCSVRTIPIPDCMIDFLIKNHSEDDTYFLTGRNDKYIEPRTMQNHFKAVLKRCGIKQTNFHSLRHTFATRCVELGFDIKSLSEILGHANVNITLARYVHPSMSLKKQNMDKLSELLAVK